MKKWIIFSLRLIAAVILFQTLFFKFTGAPESKFIFETVGAEPWGRIFSGIVELIAGVLLLVPSTQIFGAILAAGVMVGAILSHIFLLGLVVQNDGGLLFTLACIVFFSSLLILAFQPEKLRLIVQRLKGLRLG